MAIDKSLYQAPVGAANETQYPQPDIEIEVVDPEELHITLDGLEIDLKPSKEKKGADVFDANLAEYMDESDLRSLASDLISDVEDDLTSRRDWIQTYVDGLEALGMKLDERSEPWEGACGVHHPLLTEAIVKFQAETMMSTFPAAGPVKTQVIGKETPDKKEAAERVQEDMNFQLMDEMTEFRPEHERMLWGLGLSGNAFKKVYFDPQKNRQVSMFVPAEDIIVPYGASNLDSAPRVTHVMRKTENELRRLQVSGFYIDEDLGEPNNILDDIEKAISQKQGFNATSDNRYKLYEIHVELDLPGFEHEEDGEQTGIALPYVVTIEKGSNTVLAVRRNWEEEDTTYAKRQHFVHYGYVPGFGFYCFGLIHLVGSFAKSGTSIIRQLVDAGTLSNLPGGFKAKGLRVKGDDTPIGPGEFRDVDVPSGSIRDNLMALPYKEPSQTLFQLFQTIVEEGRRFAGAADLQVSDMSAQAPVGTTLAILERTLKVTSAVQARIHYSMKQELGLLKKIIGSFAPEDYDYDPDTGTRKARRGDYTLVEVIPVSDPNASTMAQKIVQYQAVLQLSQSSPQIYNQPLLHRQMLDALGIKDAHRLIPMSDDIKPTDPVTENQNILVSKPVKAFLNQDHQSHIAVHMAAMHDPKIMSLLQNNPAAQQLQAAMMAHINEHIGFEYRRQIEQELGMALPAQTDESGEPNYMNPDVEARLSPLLAQAAQQLLGKNTQEAQQAAAKQQAQDPMVQLQMQDMQIKMAEQQRKAARDKADIQLEQQKLQLEAKKLGVSAKLDAVKLGVTATSTAAQVKAQRDISEASLKQEAARTQSDLATNQADLAIKALSTAANLTHQSRKQGRDHGHQRAMQSQNLQHQKEQTALAAETAQQNTNAEPKPEV